MPQNKELKLTKPSMAELRSLTPVLGRLNSDAESRYARAKAKREGCATT
jgi:hypothetical protein